MFLKKQIIHYIKYKQLGTYEKKSAGIFKTMLPP